MIEKKHVKVIFEVIDEDNEVIKESVWANDLGNNTCQIDNIPFYAYRYACDDIVKIENLSNQMYVTELISPSGNSTIRLLFETEELLLETKKN